MSDDSSIAGKAICGGSGLPLEVAHPCWLIAIGATERVEILRSPALSVNDLWLKPVYRFISEHGLVLAAQETFEDPDWFFGKVEMSVYVPPAVRNGVLDGTAISVPWLAAAGLAAAE